VSGTPTERVRLYADDGRVGMQLNALTVQVRQFDCGHTIAAAGTTVLTVMLSYADGGQDRAFKVFHHDDKVSAFIGGQEVRVTAFALETHVVPGKSTGLSMNVEYNPGVAPVVVDPPLTGIGPYWMLRRRSTTSRRIC
jgi:hypothetical protein